MSKPRRQRPSAGKAVDPSAASDAAPSVPPSHPVASERPPSPAPASEAPAAEAPAAEGPPSARTETDPEPSEPGGPGARVAAAVTAIQALVLIGFAVFYLVELVLGQGDDAVRVVMSAVVIAFFAFLLLVVARRVWGGEGWAQTATGVWQVLLVPVGISLLQSAQVPLGILVLVLAVIAVAGLVAEQVQGATER